MKKSILFILTIFLLGFCFVGCQGQKDVIEIYLPDGAPALALVSVFDKTEIGGKKVKFTVVPTDSIGTALLSETPDLAIAPTNAIATVYNKKKGYKYVSAHTHGNLYIVGKKPLADLSELKGVAVGVIQQGNVPDLILQTLLAKNGIGFTTDGTTDANKVTLKYLADGPNVIAGLKSGSLSYGLLGEPAATTARSIEGISEVFDLQALWGGNGYPQAGLAAKNSVSDEFIKALFAAIEEAGNFALEHPDEAIERIAAHMMEGSESTIKKLSSDTVRRCNIRLVKAEDCKDDVIALLQAFFDINPKALGGVMPDDGFFRTVK